MSFLKTFARGMTTTALVAAGPATMTAKIAMIGGMNSGQFRNKIKKGVDDARLIVEANGAAVEYLRMDRYDNFSVDAADIIRVAISKNPDGIAVPDRVYESQDPAIQVAIAAGIKVILFNAGTIDKARDLGTINYVGSDENVAGKARG